ncbi:MAG TPA: response regulator transcription factor [Candidatus Eremiobacteraceae bacterium]|nr:response regulator transcription factor [Candidatus Eremiobacteraceae bacterium]
MIRVVIASDAPELRESIASTIDREPDFELTGTSTVANAADAKAADVLVVHLGQAGDARSIAALPSAVLVLTDASGDAAAALLRWGARGVLPIETADESLIAAVRAAAAGLVVVAPQTVLALGSVAPEARWTGDVHDDSRLTPRERDVLRLLAAGTGNKSIARKLSISEHTVKFHVASILSKLDVGSRTEAVTEGVRRGLVML